MQYWMSANWKMHKTIADAKALAQGLKDQVNANLPDDRIVPLFVPFTALTAVKEILADAPGFRVGAQNFYPEEQGAFTGEISPMMLKDIGIEWALTGHSERRHIFGETDDLIGKKTSYGLNQGLTIVFCIGELIEERKAGRVEEVLTKQLEIGLADVPADKLPNLGVAYEPVWAIGTGEVAGPTEIEHAHALTRCWLGKKYGEAGNAVPILYGGSVKPETTASIIAIENVNGVLVGGASLKADSFSKIVLA
ncbi:triose-phosphate isomerase [Desulfovibrio inopinatus]|uniref:triose-phosphate isomerase n=1 Tax=Desulfovibrio inopinatus TaxID=102109 RepID=UPI0003F4FE57|nr:triose-phosphate isomerase [Desulfovibrio inopinatus]